MRLGLKLHRSNIHSNKNRHSRIPCTENNKTNYFQGTCIYTWNRIYAVENSNVALTQLHRMQVVQY